MAWSLHPETRPAPAQPERISDAALLDIALALLEHIQRALIDGIHVPGHRGKPRRLSARDRDARLLEDLDRTLATLRRR
jgi:hypothetical protein